MKYTTTYIAGLIFTALILMNISTVFAQEWRVLLGQEFFQTHQLSNHPQQRATTPKDWLATRSPLLKNTPPTSIGSSSRSLKDISIDSENSRVGSWSPLTSHRWDEGFTLFTF